MGEGGSTARDRYIYLRWCGRLCLTQIHRQNGALNETFVVIQIVMSANQHRLFHLGKPFCPFGSNDTAASGVSLRSLTCCVGKSLISHKDYQHTRRLASTTVSFDGGSGLRWSYWSPAGLVEVAFISLPSLFTLVFISLRLLPKFILLPKIVCERSQNHLYISSRFWLGGFVVSRRYQYMFQIHG